MINNLLLSLSICLWLISAVFAIGAAWFEYSSRLKDKTQKGTFRNYYTRIWQWIDNNNLVYLPLLVIIRFLNLVAFISNKLAGSITLALEKLFTFYIGGDSLNYILRKLNIRRFLFGDYRKVYKITFLNFSVMAGSSSIFFLEIFQWEIAISATVLICYLDSQLPKIRRKVIFPYGGYGRFYLLIHWLIWLIQIGIVFIQLFGIIYALKFILSLNIYSRIFLLTFLTPVIGYIFGNTVLNITTSFTHYFRYFAENILFRRFEEGWMLTGLSISLSLTFTTASFILGDMFCNECISELTLQLIASNLLFDALTLFVTVFLLEKAIPLINRKSKRWNLLFIIFLDLVAAGVFAVLSIYLGVINTSQEITIIGATKILIGLQPFNALSIFEFSPFFWAMHTTFIPTLIYISLIMICFIGKIVIIPTSRFVFQGSKAEDPYHLTAGFFAFIAVIVTMLSTGLDKLLKTLFQ